jgi:hypothetical protein
VQSLDSAGLSVWGNTSAYFNGEGVLLELLAYSGTGDNRVVVGPRSDDIVAPDRGEGRLWSPD